MGELQPGTTENMTPQARDGARLHKEHVHKAYGQPFALDFFDRDSFVYDTDLPCPAVVAVRRLDAAKTLTMLQVIYQVF